MSDTIPCPSSDVDALDGIETERLLDDAARSIGDMVAVGMIVNDSEACLVRQALAHLVEYRRHVTAAQFRRYRANVQRHIDAALAQLDEEVRY